MNQSAALVPQILHFRQNDFDLKFIRNDTEIVIEAENSKTSRFYSKILSNAEIEQYDNMFYNDVLNFHKILNEGFEGRYDHVTATIDDQALITLTSKFKVAGRDRQSSIPIQLVEKQLDPMKECERLLTSLDKHRSDEWGVTENQFFNLFKRIFQNQQVLTERMEEIGHNGMNRSVPLKDKKYDGIETLEERLKRTEEQIEEINEVVVENIVPLEKNIEQIQTEVREKIEKLEKSLEKAIEENVELEKRLKKLESDDPQSSQSLQANELKQHIDTIENRFNKFEELNNVIMADTQVKVEELRKKLTEFEANHKDLSRRVERAVESPERQTKGEPSIASAEFDAVKESVESLAKRVREISQSVEFQEALQKERYIEFEKVSAETEKKLVMIKEIYVAAENRLKGLEEEARKPADIANNRPAPVPEEIKNEVEPKKESIILKNEEPVFRKDRSKPGLAIQAEFKPNFFDGDLKFTNNNQVVESPLGITIDRTLFGRNPLPKKGKYCLSVKYGNVVRGANGVFAIGVAVYNKEIDIVTPGCFFITPFEKMAYINGMDINYHSADLQKDDLICIIIDRQENLIAFEISGKVVIEDRLNPDFFDDQDLYPCIHIQQCSDLKLSFISEC